MKTLLLSLPLFFSCLAQAVESKKITLKVFLASGQILSEQSLFIPTRPRDELKVSGADFSCELDSLDIRHSRANPVHISFSYKQNRTHMNALVDLKKSTYLNINDEAFCLLEVMN